MKHGFIKVAAATPEIAVNNTKKNCENIINQISNAATNGAKVIVFPELSISGYTVGDLLFQSSLWERSKVALCEILKKTKKLDILFAVGIAVPHFDKLYNAAAVCKGGKVLGFVTKSHLPNFGEYNETRYFQTLGKTVEVSFDGYSVPMGEKLIFCCENMKNLRISCEICEDMWVTNPPSMSHAQNGATVILNLSACNETPNKQIARKMTVASNSSRGLCAYVYADAGDGESTTDLVYAGNNMIYQLGCCIKEAPLFENGIIYGILDLEKIGQARKMRTTFVPELSEEYTRVYFDLEISETSLEKISSTPFVPGEKARLFEHCDRVFKMQCAGLKKRIRHIGLKTVTIGVSGGLDSTLALLVATKTFDSLGLDRKGIIAVSMPCFGTTGRTYENSKKMADALGVTFREVSIGKSVEQHLIDIGASKDDHDVTYENAQARERTQVLMDIANKTGGIVIGTGDLSELALGFATYNGDHMSMYGVNASVPKTLMREIVRFLADDFGGEIKNILIDVVETPISPELLPPDDMGETSQKTEDIIGPYEIHDFILYHFIKSGFERSKILRMAKCAFDGMYDEKLIEKCLDTFYKRFFANQFKRSAVPDGPKAGSISLSPRGSWIMPSDAIFEE
ncbi:MAG: NAD(+) synthase [Clostridia bacterium]|nr:NAD(+) synthase [Clostridia bacterium]